MNSDKYNVTSTRHASSIKAMINLNNVTSSRAVKLFALFLILKCPNIEFYGF